MRMKSRKAQSGQAMLESALVLVMFLVVLIGIVDMGQFLYFHQSLTERARAAARYGAVGTDDARIVVTINNYQYRFLSPYMSKSTWLRTIIAVEPYEILP